MDLRLAVLIWAEGDDHLPGEIVVDRWLGNEDSDDKWMLEGLRTEDRLLDPVHAEPHMLQQTTHALHVCV